jgi:hypothetical protein
MVILLGKINKMLVCISLLNKKIKNTFVVDNFLNSIFYKHLKFKLFYMSL